jgi:hypothetical protein
MSEFNLSAWALRNRSVIAFFMIIAVAAGLASYFRLGRSEDPSFIIKTMVVQAAWPGASVEDTLKQVTERLERKLQETPKLDFLRSLTRAGVTTIFVNLLGSTTAWEVPDIWYHVRKSIGDIRHTLPAGILGPGFNADARLAIDAKYRLGRIGKAAANLRDVAEAQHASADSEVDGAHVLLGAEGARHPQGQRLAAGLDRAGGKHDVLRLQGIDQRGPVEAEAGEFLHGELDKDPLPSR